MEYKNGNNIYGMLINEISMGYQWEISLYPPLIKCCRLENPRTKWPIFRQNMFDYRRVYFHHVSSIRGSFNNKNGDSLIRISWETIGIYCFFPCCQGTRKETCCSRYIKFSGVVLNPAWTSARLAPPIKFKHQAMWNKWKANKSTKKMTRKNGETKWENLSGK